MKTIWRYFVSHFTVQILIIIIKGKWGGGYFSCNNFPLIRRTEENADLEIDDTILEEDDKSIIRLAYSL